MKSWISLSTIFIFILYFWFSNLSSLLLIRFISPYEPRESGVNSSRIKHSHSFNKNRVCQTNLFICSKELKLELEWNGWRESKRLMVLSSGMSYSLTSLIRHREGINTTSFLLWGNEETKYPNNYKTSLASFLCSSGKL